MIWVIFCPIYFTLEVSFTQRCSMMLLNVSNALKGTNLHILFRTCFSYPFSEMQDI